MPYDFLFANLDVGGSVPTFATAIRRLRARGHTVRILIDDTARAEVEAAGGDFVPWTLAPNRRTYSLDEDPVKDWAPTEPGGDLLRVLDHITFGPAAAYAADTLAELRRRPADAVISLDLLFGPPIAARAAGVPVVSLATQVSVFVPIPGVPPVGPGLLPATSAEDEAVAAGVAGWFAEQVNERLPVLNEARMTFGLPALADALEHPREADLLLVATSRAFDFPAQSMPDKLSYVGPLLDPPSWSKAWTSPWSADDDRPLILVAMSSTFQNQAPTIQAVLDAAAGLPVRVLVTLGPGLADATLATPANAVAVASAPHDQVMAEAAVVVTHCGHGTVMRALANGCPLLCLPMGRDQNENAARVAARGAGIRLTRDAEAFALRAALVKLLEDPSYARSAKTLGRAIAEAEPSDALADALERLVAETCNRAKVA
jgi:MGT family glycosyltransferase